MKKIYSVVLFIIGILLVAGFSIAQGTSGRYFIKSNNGFLKAQLGIQHNFDNGFTSDLTQGQIRALQKVGVEVEEVAIYHLLARPICGNGECEPGENAKKCPEDCSTTPEPDPEPRTCYPSAQKPYGITMVNGGTGGAGINVAVLDTGVNTNHPDLDVKLCNDATKRGIRAGCTDSIGHGTHVSGTIAANTGSDGKGIMGVAPEANLWMVKVCGHRGCYTDDIAEAIMYATDQGANIISMSLGGDSESLLIKNAIDYAVGKDVLVIAAAGNDGPYYGSIDYPGANVNVMAVGAIDANKNVASWSSRGINDGDYTIEEREVEVGAPGVNIESTSKDGCYTTMSGTSMATPHVAGLAAKLWQGSASATRTYLQNLSRNHDLFTTGDDPATGFGLPIAP